MNTTRVSIVDLLATGTPVHPHEAAAIILEVCAQVGRQPARARTLPPLDALILESTGALVARERHAFPEPDFVPHVGRMLRQLLANRGFAQAPVAGERLLAVAARAVDGETPVIASVKALGDAIGRLEPAWRREFLRDLFERAIQPADAPQMPLDLQEGAADAVPTFPLHEPLSLEPARAFLEGVAPDAPRETEPIRSAPEQPVAVPRKTPVKGQKLVAADLSGAREAAGLSLDEIARRTRIALPLLRELEAGSLKHWPEGGVYRRSWLRAYAAEVGLHPDAVLKLFSPQLGSADWPEFAQALRQARVLAEAEAAGPGGRRPLLHRLVGAATGLFALVAMAGRLGSR